VGDSAGETIKVDYLPLPAYVWREVDGCLRLVGCNEAALALEPAARDTIGMTIEELAVSNPSIARSLHRAFAGRTVVSTEAPYVRRADGANRLLAGTYVYAPPDTVIVHVDDVTERRQQERSARAADARLRAAFASSPIGQAIISLGPPDPGRVVEVNDAFCELFGRVREELLGGLPATDGLPVDALAVGLADVARRVTHDGGTCRFEKHFVRADGTTIAATVWVSLLDDASAEDGLALAHFQDVTERNAAEAALRAGEARYRQIVETTSEGVWLIDADHRTTFVNARMGEMLGYRVEEMLGTTLDRYTLEGAQPPVREKIAGREPGTARQDEEVLRRRDGSPLWVSMSTDSIVDDEGRFVGALAMMTDITERKLSEAQLEEAMARFEGAFTHAPTAMALVSLTQESFGDLLMVNAAFCEMIGYAEHEIVGRRMADFTHPADAWRDAEVARRVAAGQADGFQIDKRLISAGGNTILTNMSASFVPGADGRPAYGVVHLQDITARRRVEQELEERERRFRAAFSSALDAMLIADDDRRWIEGNEAAAKLLGIAAAEIQGRRIDEFSSAAAADVEMAWQQFLRAGRATGAYELRRPNGEVRHVEFSATANFTPGRHLSILRDVTERKAAEDESEFLENLLQQAQRLETVGQLAGGVAHDFNNLLAVILNSCDFALSALGEHPAAEDIQAIRAAGERAAALTRQLLVFSRGEIAEPQVVDLNELVSDVERLLRRTIGEHINFDVVLDRAAPSVQADPSHLEQVLLNLAVNARDAMPGGGTLRVETSLVHLGRDEARLFPGTSPGPHALLVVGDDGTGMLPEVVAKAFEPFFTTKPKGHGTGLGLATTYGIVTQNGGHIELRSELGEGTEARVFLPLTEREAELSVDAAVVAPRAGQGERVLVVEDEEGVRSLARRILEGAGYVVVVADDAQEAIDLLDRSEVDVVVTDIVMPGMSGPKLVEQLRRARPDLRAIFMSGYTDRPGALPTGVPFLSKPFSGRELLELVARVLDH
jgi:two-component system cell cycle sensor histidine kinase/response regulator CckA